MTASNIRSFSELSSCRPYIPAPPHEELEGVRKRDAAHRILKAWRHSRAAQRENVQKRYIPVVTRLYGKGKLPDCRLMTPEAAAALDCHPFHGGSVYVTPAAILQYLAIAESAPPLTKKQVDVLASTLSRQKELLALDFPFDGCFTRTSILLDMLALSGLSLKNMCRQYVSIPQQFRAEGAPEKWSFHVALLIRLADGSLEMLDPLLSPERGASPQEWVDLQKSYPSSILPIDMVNLDLLFPDTPLNFSYDHEQQGLTFRTIRDIGVEFDPSKSILSVGVLTPKYHRDGLEKLASYRHIVEQYMLARTIPASEDWEPPKSLRDFLFTPPKEAQEAKGPEAVDETD